MPDTQFNIHALMAEDNQVNQKVVKKLMDTLNITLDFASDGAEAVSLAKENRYDIIYMDMQMPLMNGMTATQRIREFSEVPIIALTANVSPEDKKYCFEIGMNGFIGKPISREALIEETERVLNKG